MSTRENQREWTRRQVLATSCTAVGALAVGGRSFAQGSGEQDGPYHPFKMGLQSYSLRGYTRRWSG